MKVRTKSSVFTEIMHVVFLFRQPFQSARLMFYVRWFSKQKSNSSMQQFHWRILRLIFSVITARRAPHPFVWIPLHCNFYAIRYYHLIEDCRKAWNFKGTLSGQAWDNFWQLKDLKMMKNAFYFILKTLFVLKIFNFFLTYFVM